MSTWDGRGDEDGDTKEKVIDRQVQTSLVCVQEHEHLLRGIESAVAESNFQVPDSYRDPVVTHGNAPEVASVQDLIATRGNPTLQKVLIVFVYLCEEIHELTQIAESTFYPSLALFGESARPVEDHNPVLAPGKRETTMARMLPLLQELSSFVTRCRSVSVNIIQQISSLYSSTEKLWKTCIRHVQLVPVWRSLGELLRVLITLDSIIQQNPSLLPCWTLYKRLIEHARAEAGRYATEEGEVRVLEELLLGLDQTVMAGDIFEGCIEQDYEQRSHSEEGEDLMVNIRGNETFLNTMLEAIKHLLDHNVKGLNKDGEVQERQEVVGVFGLYALYRRLCPARLLPDAKLYKRLWGVQKDLPVVVLNAKTVWFPPEFLTKYAPFDVRKLEPQDVESFRRQVAARLDEEFPLKVQGFCQHVYAWVTAAEAKISSSARYEKDQALALNSRGSLVFQGLTYACRLSSLVTTLLSLHVTLGLPLLKRLIRPLSIALELLKLIEFTLSAKLPTINESIPVIFQVNFKVLLLKVIQPIREKVEASRRFDELRTDVIASLNLMETILKGADTPSFSRQMVLRLAFRIVLGAELLRDAEADQVLQLFKKLEVLACYQQLLRHSTSACILFWNKELFGIFLDDIYAAGEPSRLPFLVAALTDVLAYMKRSATEDDQGAKLISTYESYLLESLEDRIVRPLCRDVENDLRLHIHTKTLEHLSAINPKRIEKKALRPFLDLRSLRVITKCLNIKTRVTHYLEAVFYNLTTVAVHDWMTYAEMRSLALEKYGLHISENHLPMGGLDQGLDVLQIMRHIHVFVSRFTYNMNMQNFVERQPKTGAKHIHTINIQSIAASLRQHGLGILNTTVNFTYQYLAQKFQVFSQFLFDDYISSNLSKERRWYKKNRDTLNNLYPYEHGVELLRQIRRLGPKEGRTFMDQFRLLATEIGNALGYVRMVRSAGMYFTSEAVKYLPNVDDIVELAPLSGPGSVHGYGGNGGKAVAGAGLSAETVRAAQDLDQVISTLIKNFSEGNDFFRVLLRVFQEVLMGARHKHLDSFYMIIPALCVAFVEDAVIGKEMMHKPNRKGEAYYTDDGFAMGVAYILAILDQQDKFESLHWFEAVDLKLKDDERALTERQKLQTDNQRRDSKPTLFTSLTKKTSSASSSFSDADGYLHEDEEEAQALLMSFKRLGSLRREYDMLFYALNGARIFFMGTK